MHLLEPRPVDAEAPRRWIKQAFELVARRPGTAAVGSCILLAAFFLVLGLEPSWLKLMLVAVVPATGVLCFLRQAEAADHSEPLSPTHWVPSPGATAVVALILLLGCAPVVALLWPMAAWQPTVEAAPVPPPNFAVNAVGGLGLAVKGVLFGSVLTGFATLLVNLWAWFVLPLMLLRRLKLFPAILLSARACRRNARHLALNSVLTLAGCLLAVVVTLGAASVLLAPVLGALLYVSYREVFLGRDRNLPAVQRVGAGAAETA